LVFLGHVEVNDYVYMNVDDGHDYVLMLIMAMLVNNHGDAC